MRNHFLRLESLSTLLVGASLAAAFTDAARAADAIKIGFIAPSTGQFAQIGNMMIPCRSCRR